MAQVASCLALVRPVSMSDVLADEWIKVVAKELRGHTDGDVAAACAKARRECRRPGEILPTVIAECERLQEARSTAKAREALRPKMRPEPEHVYPTLRELEDHLRWLNGAGAIQHKLRSTGLGLGALIEVDGGRVHPAPGVWKYTEGAKTFVYGQ